MPEFNTSRYGIIIPASRERRGCVRTFWVGRLFRIYPLWAAVVTALLAANHLAPRVAGDAQPASRAGASWAACWR
ncbi:hypothetical protein [Streptomyces sp. CC219B]|uniref:hypothetical protein n=1 Tax=Streptomyces sp. CC219B TaxID=3044574 RepID=UPI0024A8C736|nr:hypothetical protein [Streptomyces sp. CC219B]